MLRRTRLHRAFALTTKLVVIARMLAVVLGLQLSGLGAATAEALWSISDERAGAPERCPEGRPCDDCPPSCPNCHCSNGILTIVPQVGAVPVTALVGVRQRQESFGSLAPLVPELAGVFRPPCSFRLSLERT